MAPFSLFGVDELRERGASARIDGNGFCSRGHETAGCRPDPKWQGELSGNAAAAAGPTGAQATSFNSAEMTADVLTYSRSKGMFAGVSLEGASIDADNHANKKLYGESMTAKSIITGDTAVPAAAKPLVDLLDHTSPKGK